ncbi:hypothetical protein [Nitrogeniibacter aestuarii]|uniref:hypothetical protein n=1 Tax=Nitrogeniibacter aestuarii TaxID=2815343 RepID=UPI001E39E524|nr:hypothetical protein [Nitrogeniibacter aestuarii]
MKAEVSSIVEDDAPVSFWLLQDDERRSGGTRLPGLRWVFEPVLAAFGQWVLITPKVAHP